MAKEIKMYKANDGSFHPTLKQAQDCDELCATVEDICSSLCAVPDGRFGNEEHGYIQQDPATVTAVKVRLVEIAASLDIEWFKEHLPVANSIHPMSVAGRLMDECAPGPLADVWQRLCRIDEQGREWEQPYFALNPSAGCQYPYGEEKAGL